MIRIIDGLLIIKGIRSDVCFNFKEKYVRLTTRSDNDTDSRLFLLNKKDIKEFKTPRIRHSKYNDDQKLEFQLSENISFEISVKDLSNEDFLLIEKTIRTGILKLISKKNRGRLI